MVNWLENIKKLRYTVIRCMYIWKVGNMEAVIDVEGANEANRKTGKRNHILTAAVGQAGR